MVNTYSTYSKQAHKDTYLYSLCVCVGYVVGRAQRREKNITRTHHIAAPRGCAVLLCCCVCPSRRAGCRVPPLLSVSLPCLSPPPPPHRGRCRPPPLRPAVQSAALPRLRSPRIRLVRVRVRVPLLQHSARCDRAHARDVLAAAGRAATDAGSDSHRLHMHMCTMGSAHAARSCTHTTHTTCPHAVSYFHMYSGNVGVVWGARLHSP